MRYSQPFFTVLLIFAFMALNAALPFSKTNLSKAEVLHTALHQARTGYDVTFYDLTVEFDTLHKSIKGRSAIHFTVKDSAEVLQIDLAEQFKVDSVIYRGENIPFMRQYGAIFIAFADKLSKGISDSVTVCYNGKPQTAKHAPWDGGFVWSHDEAGNPWIAVACEGLGASSWWACKDHPSDEPDSLQITCIVPANLAAICNGNLRAETHISDTQKAFTWFVSYPINLYNVTFYIGKYTHFHDDLMYSDSSHLDLDYYVMPYNETKARAQFQQVKPMLLCYEKYLGKYPFMRDGYALVESPYLGMEHQSAIAYGNKYKPGYDGHDYSQMGMTFDYIIIHESGHEWWGNNVSCADMADMWIHESFCTYTESIFVECNLGKEKAVEYINAQKNRVKNQAPIQGVVGSNEEGDGDMYAKGSLMLNSLRSVINNDTIWWDIIKGIQDSFKLKTVSAEDIIGYFNGKAQMNLTPVFKQYLKYGRLPKLHYSVKKIGKKDYEFRCSWEADVSDFNMPVIVEADGQKVLIPTKVGSVSTQVFRLKNPSSFTLKPNLTYFDYIEE